MEGNGGAPARRIGSIAAHWLVTCALLFAIWLLLVDNYSLPELLTGVGAAAIAATGSELVRMQRIAEILPRGSWLLRTWRPVVRAPRDVVLVLAAIVRQLVRPRARRGFLRAVPFRYGADDAEGHARRALASGVGSFAPNTIVIGIDQERELLLVHQLVRSGDARSAADPMELG
jgi:multisubunit Na+/H+ antiporter MnhE subunit